jgi:hypothetical protein
MDFTSSSISQQAL